VARVKEERKPLMVRVKAMPHQPKKVNPQLLMVKPQLQVKPLLLKVKPLLPKVRLLLEERRSDKVFIHPDIYI
tara:strand:- start:36 stop:254 length:219 start_codon:yes stop_codon:yes gene_type:complete